LRALANEVGFISQSITKFRGDAPVSNLEYPWLLIRELAIQIAEQFEALGSAIGLRCSVVSVVNAIMQVNVYANSFLAVSI
jgi:hypothetical protein